MRNTNNIEGRINAYIAKKQRTKEKKLAKQDANISMFLAIKEEVEDSLARGHTMRLTWELMYYEEKKITFGYDPFRKYVAKYLKREEQINEGVTKTTNDIAAHGAVQKQTKAKSEGFAFNPEPNIKDLI